MATVAITMQRTDLPEVVRRTTKRSFVLGAWAGACDIVIADDPQVLTAHVRVIVRRSDLAVVLRPFPDAIVTVNSQSVTTPVQLAASDRVEIGVTQIRFEVEGEPSGRRWWNPRDWGRDEEAPLAPRVPPGNPPMVVIPPEPALPPTWNPIPPVDRSPILPLPGNPPATRSVPMPRPKLPLPPPRWRATLAVDPTEHALLAAIRDAPNDLAARMVYADWLETAGRTRDAGAVRGELDVAIVPATDPAWRALAMDAPIAECPTPTAPCPGKWNALDGVPGDEAGRACAACGKRVYYAVTLQDIEMAGQHGVPYAPDFGLGEGDPAMYAVGRRRR